MASLSGCSWSGKTTVNEKEHFPQRTLCFSFPQKIQAATMSIALKRWRTPEIRWDDCLLLREFWACFSDFVTVPKIPKQWLSTSLMLQPFNTGPHAVVIPQPSNYFYFATNDNVNTFGDRGLPEGWKPTGWELMYIMPESGMMACTRDLYTQRQMQEGHKFQTIFGYTTRFYLKTPNNETK